MPWITATRARARILGSDTAHLSMLQLKKKNTQQQNVDAANYIEQELQCENM